MSKEGNDPDQVFHQLSLLSEKGLPGSSLGTQVSHPSHHSSASNSHAYDLLSSHRTGFTAAQLLEP